MHGLLASLALIAMITVDSRGGHGFSMPPIRDIWQPFLITLLGLASVAAIAELGWRARRHRGRLPACSDRRVLHTIRFESRSAGSACLRITSDLSELVARLAGTHPEAWRVLLCGEAVGKTTCQSEQIRAAVEALLVDLCAPEAAPSLCAQLRVVGEFMRHHPFTRFERIVDQTHPSVVHRPVPAIDLMRGRRGFPVKLLSRPQARPPGITPM
jgi:hypothetical protein